MDAIQPQLQARDGLKEGVLTSLHLVDPELAPFIGQFPVLDFANVPLADLRRRINEMLASSPAPQEPVEIVDVARDDDRNAAPVAVHMIRPVGRRGKIPALLHIHGGGYVVGSPAMAAEANARLASTLGCAIFSVDYRLAPETPYPGALEDCYAVLKWLYREADELGIDRDRIGVKGESAGAGLAAALALLARDRSEVSIAFQHLIQPMLDDRTCTCSEDHPYAGEFIWSRAHNVFGWTAYLGFPPGARDVASHAVPARAADLSNLPPTFISIGALDLFLEESLEFARRLTRCGVAVELHVHPGAYHGFELVADSQVAMQARRDSTEALRKAMCL